jgi:hypothetical protein
MSKPDDQEAASLERVTSDVLFYSAADSTRVFLAGTYGGTEVRKRRCRPSALEWGMSLNELFVQSNRIPEYSVLMNSSLESYFASP